MTLIGRLICLELVEIDGPRLTAKLQCGHEFHLGFEGIEVSWLMLDSNKRMRSWYDCEVDLNKAIQMISYYASSSELAQIRGETNYLTKPLQILQGMSCWLLLRVMKFDKSALMLCTWMECECFSLRGPIVLSTFMIMKNIYSRDGHAGVMKIRVQFKDFLLEATGFYPDLMLKIISKYGLPLGQYSENHLNTGKDETKSAAEMKKGLIPCHRYLIYALYKGSIVRVNQKIGFCSSIKLLLASYISGNPHHKLAMMASYSGEESVVVYRHFRSIAIEIPFPTAKDNLVIVF